MFMQTQHLTLAALPPAHHSTVGHDMNFSVKETEHTTHPPNKYNFP